VTSALVVRGTTVLEPDPTRVVARQFLPGQEILSDGRSRVETVITAVLGMTDATVNETLDATVALFAGRHDDLAGVFRRHFDSVTSRQVSVERAALIGAYFTQEYALESTALFNPSMVPHPDQSGLAPGELRFLMTVRSVGEGHLSSVQLRSGVIGSAPPTLRVDPPGRPRSGTHSPASLSRDVLLAALADRTVGVSADELGPLLPDRLDGTNLEEALTRVRREYLNPSRGRSAVEQVRWVFRCDYAVDFDDAGNLADATLLPAAPDESHGMEDVRCTRFVEEDGSVSYLATYTAYDGDHITSHLLRTDDFRHFDVHQLLGPSARGKGMAVFPRRVDGEFAALVRSNHASIGVARSADLRWWEKPVTVQTPHQPWQLIQLGNCGPPIETEAGWLVLDHGVGPIRRYGIGAILLDRHDPTRLVGALPEALLMPEEDERDGYVPNVVYSCGALRHGNVLVLPYGCSDTSIRFAFVDLPQLVARLGG
jgi:predicted GH43/DUF377 family glycosyl hydrolase